MTTTATTLRGPLTVEVSRQGRWWPHRTVRFCATRAEAADALWKAYRDRHATLIRIFDADLAVVREYRRPGR